MSLKYCVRYVVFGFTIMFMVIGVVGMSGGGVLQIFFHPYSVFMTENLEIFPIILLIIGAIILIFASLGFWGVLNDNLCMISSFSVLLILLCIAEIIAVVGVFVFHDIVRNVIADKMDLSLQYYDSDPQVAKSWDILQNTLHCCGVNGTDDWKDRVPQSCCSEIGQDEECQRKNAYVHGCLNVIFTAFEKNSLSIALITALIAFTEMIGVGFACCFLHSIHKGYETV